MKKVALMEIKMSLNDGKNEGDKQQVK